MKLIFPFLFFLIISMIFIIGAKILNKNGRTYRGNGLLCKSQSNRVFAGVCGGIAEYFGWNATVVRLFFIFSGIGLLTYAILSIAIPDSPSSLL
ncbi:MAG: PspC domain-containing protein [Anaerovorax sp.]|nr:PspC domain-containing protein [Anaerovorax sp.]